MLYRIPINELLVARSIKTVAVIVIETLVIFLVIRPVLNIFYKKGWIVPEDIIKKD
jgi:hypothetical protein